MQFMKQTYYDEKSHLTYVFASWGFSTHDCLRRMPHSVYDFDPMRKLTTLNWRKKHKLRHTGRNFSLIHVGIAGLSHILQSDHAFSSQQAHDIYVDSMSMPWPGIEMIGLQEGLISSKPPSVARMSMESIRVSPHFWENCLACHLGRCCDATNHERTSIRVAAGGDNAKHKELYFEVWQVLERLLCIAFR